MTDELKPCPFCGSEATIKPLRLAPGRIAIYCAGCPAEMDDEELDFGQIIAAWNRRPPSTPTP